MEKFKNSTVFFYTSNLIKRWNEQPKTVEFVEMDKQSHKLFNALLLATYEKDINWLKLFEYSFASTIINTVLTDIKFNIYKRIEDNPSARENVKHFVKNKIKELNLSNIVEKLINEYFCDENSKEKLFSKEKLLLSAGSFLATKYEFDFIYPIAKNTSFDIEEIKEDIDLREENYLHLEGFKIFNSHKKMSKLSKLFGQLRFQKRWLNKNFEPSISVLGHMYYVSFLTYLFTFEYGEDLFIPEQVFLNLFGALIHDIPEAYTRDVISPVKEGIPELDKVLKEIESQFIKDKVIPITPPVLDKLIQEIFLRENKRSKHGNEFGDKIIKFKNKEYQYQGSLIKIADIYSSYIEIMFANKNKIYDEIVKRIKKSFEKTLKNQDVINITNKDEVLPSKIMLQY